MALASLTFTGVIGNNTPMTISSDTIRYSDSLPSTNPNFLYSSGNVVLYDLTSFDAEDEQVRFYLSYQGETYEFFRLDVTSFDTYYSIGVTCNFQSNLYYHLLINDSEGDFANTYYSPEYIDMEDEDIYFSHFYGDSSTTRRYNIRYPDSEGGYSDLRIGLIIEGLDERMYNSVLPEYSENYQNGYNDGYRNGKQDGLTEGYDSGYYDGDSEGYQRGYSHGYTEAANQDSVATSIFVGIIDVALLPINFFLACLNFEVFGINIGSFVTALLTIVIVVILFRTIFGGKARD